jgi:hypothetical protein
MATAQESVLIRRDQREVFDYLADPERHHDWNLSLLRTEMVDVGRSVWAPASRTSSGSTVCSVP